MIAQPGDGGLLFPLIRSTFFAGALGACSPGAGTMHGRSTLPPLSIPTLRDPLDAPTSETGIRRERYKFFEKQCSEILPGERHRPRQRPAVQGPCGAVRRRRV